MTILDGILIVVMLISAGLAMIRGFTREVFSIASWVAAGAAAYIFWEDLLPFTQKYIDDKTIALGATVAAIFLVTLIVVSMITMRISDFILDSKAGPLDRTLGFVFGAGRGLVLVVIGVLFLNFFMAEENQPAWITDARTYPWLDSIGNDILNALPEDPEAEILERFRQDDQERSADAPEPAPGSYRPEDRKALSRQVLVGSDG